MIKNLLIFIFAAILFASSLSPSIVDENEFVLKMKESYLNAVADSDFLSEDVPGMIFKGMLLLVTGLALLIFNTVGSLDISPAIWGILMFIFLPVEHIIAILWVIHEKIYGLSCKITRKKGLEEVVE